MKLLTRLLYDPLTVHKIENDGVLLNDFKKLYGFKLASLKEANSTINPKELENFRRSCVANSLMQKNYNQLLYLVFYKTKVGDIYDLDIFFLTEDEEIARFVKGNFPVKALDGIELTNTLLRLQTLSEDLTLLKDKKIVREIEIFSKELFNKYSSLDKKDKFLALLYSNTSQVYAKVLSEKLFEKEIAYYVGAFPLEAEIVDIERLLYSPWEGALWIVLNLNDISVYITERRKFIPDEEKPLYKEVEEEYKKGNVDLLGLWVYFATPADTPMGVVDEVFSALSLKPLKISFNLPGYVFKTPLRERDKDYLLLKSTDYASKLLVKEYRKFYKHQNPLIYGTDRFGVYVNLDTFDTVISSNPHMAFLGKSGSGKSFSLLTINKQILNVDLKRLYERSYSPEEAGRVKVRIRYFDKGFSGEIFFKTLKANGFPVGIGAIKVEEMLFNPFDIKTEDREKAKDFVISFINTVLEILNIEPLKGFEETYFSEYVLLFLEYPDRYNSIARSLTPATLQRAKNPIWETIIKRIIKEAKERKYSREEIERLLTKSFYEISKELNMPNLAKPTVADMLALLKKRASDPDLSSKDKEVFESLIQKLQAFVNNSPFGYFSLLDIENYPIFYTDFEELMKHRFFTPFVMAILYKLLEKDKYEKPIDEKAFYFFDEVHNLFRVKAFRDFLRVLTLEMRRFRISLVFATQNAEHFSADVLSNLDTHILVSPNETSVKEYLTVSKLEGSEDAKLMLESILPSIKRAGRRFLLIRGTSQLFTLSLPVSKLDLEMLDTSRTELVLKDGTVIRKSLREGKG